MTTVLRRHGVVHLVVAVGVSACGGRSLTSTEAPSGGAPATGVAGASSGGTDSAATGAAGAGGSAADSNPGLGGTPVSQPAEPRGYLTAVQSITGANSFAYTVLGRFARGPGRFDGCTEKQIGACTAYFGCPSVSSAAPADSAPVDAGELSVVGASGTIPIPRAVDASYAAAGQAELWPPLGGSITFAGSGSVGVPAFTLTVIAPPSVLLIAFNGAAAPSSLVRSAGAKLEWTAVGSGNVVFELDSNNQTRPEALACQFLASAGAGEVSAAALSALTSGFYLWHLEGISTEEMDEGAWHLEADLSGFGSQTTGQEIQIQ